MYKSKLQELCQRHYWNLPEYEWAKEGPDHNPRFVATATVNNATFKSPGEFGSAKEAQNEAAKIAFLYYSSTSGTSEPQLDQHKRKHPPSLDAIPKPETSTSSEVLHLYKNRLQSYAQKRNLTLPVYSCETEGPAHACHFKSMVTLDGKTYGTSNFYRTLKEAEHAAAKVAYESLAIKNVSKDDGLFKCLLQEWAQRENLQFPVYETTRMGPPHMATFVSTVKIRGDVFNGQEAKTKKQAEMSSAKVAYICLTEGSKPLISSHGDHMMETSNVSSSYIESMVSNARQQNVEPCGKLRICDEHGSEENGSIAELATVARGTVRCTKILVYPRKIAMTDLDGSTILPFSDDRWVARRID